MTFSKIRARSAVLTLAAGAALASYALPASAEIVCNRWHECWHEANHYDYPAAVGVVVHPDAWREHRAWRRYHWMRDHDNDRGYWRHGVWVTLPG